MAGGAARACPCPRRRLQPQECRRHLHAPVPLCKPERREMFPAAGLECLLRDPRSPALGSRLGHCRCWSMQFYCLLLLLFDALMLLRLGSGWPDTCHADGKALRPAGFGLCGSEPCWDHHRGTQFPFGAWKQLLYFLQLIMGMLRALEGGCIPSPNADTPVSGRSCGRMG